MHRHLNPTTPDDLIFWGAYRSGAWELAESLLGQISDQFLVQLIGWPPLPELHQALAAEGKRRTSRVVSAATRSRNGFATLLSLAWR